MDEIAAVRSQQQQHSKSQITEDYIDLVYVY